MTKYNRKNQFNKDLQKEERGQVQSKNLIQQHYKAQKVFNLKLI